MNRKLALILLLFTLGHATVGFSADGKAKANKNAKTQAKKKKTIGELLRQEDRGSKVSLQKKQQNLPTAQDTLKKTKTTVNLNAVKPPSTSSFYDRDGDDKARLEQITDEQIRELFKLTQKFKNSPQRGELWLRLAELYVEKAGIIEFRKQNEFDNKLKAYQSGQSKIKPSLNLAEAREYNRKAIQLYEWFVRDFPKDPKIDQAYFFIGYNSYELGDLKKGTGFYTKLTKEFPKSQFVVEANFALAEYYFENDKYKNALDHYSKVLAYPRHRLFMFSLYKSAWCNYRTGKPQLALSQMEKLIRSEKNEATGVTGKKISKNRLENEGLRDIVLFYAEAGDPAKAANYFKSLAGDDAKNYIEKLAYFYADKGNREGTKILFNHLISQSPNSPKAFDYKYQIVQVYSNARQSRDFREEMYTWIKDFGVGSAWYQANKQNKELVENSYKLRETTLRNYTLQQHQTAQNSRAPYSQALASEGYKLYISEFPDSAMIADMRFYYGELLYDMRKFDEASTQYRWVVDNAPQSKFSSRAAENVVLSLEKDIPSDEAIAKKVGQSVDPVDFDIKVERFIQVGQWYINRFPENEKSADIKFRMGRLYYQHNQFDLAIPYFKEIVEKYPKTKYAEYSANLLLDIYNIKKDYAGLEKTGAELLAVPGIANSRAGSDIKGVLEKANFKKAQDLEVAKDYKGSAEQFEAFSVQNKTSPLVVTAMFNAAINYERAGMAPQALNAHVFVLKSNDKSAEKLKPKSRRILAKLYQDAGMLEEAATNYKLSANEMGNDPLVPNLYYNAAVLFEALGKNDEAAKNYESYFAKSKKAEKVESLYQIATMFRRQGALSKASGKYKDYVNMGGGQPEKNVESAFWVYEIAKKINRPGEADDWRKKTLGLQKNYSPDGKGIGASYAAKIKFADSKKSFDIMKSIRIPADPQKQQKAAKEKIDYMTRLNSELAAVIKYDSPEEIVGALALLGEASLHLGEALIAAPLPAGLTADEQKQYKAGIEQIANPFFVKAKESLKAAIDRSSELDAYTEATKRSRDLLSKIDSSSAVDHGEVSLDFKQISYVGN